MMILMTMVVVVVVEITVIVKMVFSCESTLNIKKYEADEILNR